MSVGKTSTPGEVLGFKRLRVSCFELSRSRVLSENTHGAAFRLGYAVTALF